jgi:pSer/pThr/pTyr-binding forkhead associated (FHA) protein
VLESATVNELHARLYRDSEDNFFLADQESIAGTWVNYAPITSGGTRLEHGDLIHIGKVLFRFEIMDPARIPTAEIKVTDLEL